MGQRLAGRGIGQARAGAGVDSGRTVQRILDGADLKPHRFECWKRKTDLQLEVKMRPIVGLSLNPPDDGPAWCCDEMTCIQALEHCFPNLPLCRPGELAKRSFEHIRHGTRCLLAAFEAHTGRVLGRLCPWRCREEFITLPQEVIHLVLDNLNIHRSPLIDEWLADHPGRVVLHLLPFHASW